MQNKLGDTTLELESLKKDHGPRLFEVLKDPKIYTYIPEDPPTSQDALADKFDSLSKGAPNHLSQIWLNYAIYNSEISQYIGTLQATIFKDSQRRASVAYLLNSNYWGSGYATKALSLMVSELHRH